MKLLRANKRYRYYGMRANELPLLLFVLDQYPILRTRPQRISKLGEGGSIEEADALLQAALAAQRKQAKTGLRRWFKSPNRFTQTDEGIELRIECSRHEWLLQILNDLRVGAWTQLGSPENLEQTYAKATAANGHFVLLMEAAGMFQSALLDGAD